MLLVLFVLLLRVAIGYHQVIDSAGKMKHMFEIWKDKLEAKGPSEIEQLRQQALRRVEAAPPATSKVLEEAVEIYNEEGKSFKFYHVCLTPQLLLYTATVKHTKPCCMCKALPDEGDDWLK